MRLMAISGLPRSGSTLLCNLLAQNPRFFASSTSCIPQLLQQISAFYSASPEIKSELAADRDETEARIRGSLRGLVEGWYSGRHEPVVFDKSRAWSHNAALLFDLFPDAHLVVCVRDLRDVFGSIERRHQEFPAFDDAVGNDKTILARADRMFSPDGMIGMPVVGVEDLMRRRPSQMSIVQYETFTARPAAALDRLYAEMGEDPFSHDFDNVESAATDLDALYLHKFPHSGSGKVRPPDKDGWRQTVPQDIAGLIMQRFPGYNAAFGYTG